MKNKIAILIVNFNSSEFIELSLYALERLTNNNFEVFILDNGSRGKDYRKLKKIIKGRENVFLERSNTVLRGSMAHGTALNYLVKRVTTPYFSILDADATWLKKDWDEILIKRMNNKLCVIGTQAPKEKPQDFPLMFGILFRTKEFQRLKIDFRPKDIAKRQDTGWNLRKAYFKEGLKGECIKFFNTRYFKKGPFAELVVVEYYLEREKHIFASHFGRGSTLGLAKYKKDGNFFTRLPVLRSIFARALGKKEKQKWIDICREIINNQVNL